LGGSKDSDVAGVKGKKASLKKRNAHARKGEFHRQTSYSCIEQKAEIDMAGREQTQWKKEGVKQQRKKENEKFGGGKKTSGIDPSWTIDAGVEMGTRLVCERANGSTRKGFNEKD